MKIGILRETRRYKDRRVALTPQLAAKVKKYWPDVEIIVQPSNVRVFPDSEYAEAGITIQEDVSECDILIGVKEVSEETLIEGKTYIMFAHVAKMQEHNHNFFQEMARKKITLLDYEYFTDNRGVRLVAFGHWAGVVGAYYALKGILKCNSNTEIPHPSALYDAEELVSVVSKIELPPIKIVITGDGRVGQGAAFVLRKNGAKEVDTGSFLTQKFKTAVFCVLPFSEYVRPREGSGRQMDDFFKYPGDFESTFQRFTRVADVYIPSHFWHPESPVFFTKEDVKDSRFTITMISDISCDVPGPVPTTLRTSEHDDPYYDVDREKLEELPAFSTKGNITVSAVDNLPTALPRNASETFASELYNKILPSLLGDDKDGIIERATILKNGEPGPFFGYLADFLT